VKSRQPRLSISARYAKGPEGASLSEEQKSTEIPEKLLDRAIRGFEDLKIFSSPQLLRTLFFVNG